MGNSLSRPTLLRDEDPLSKLNTEVFHDACGTPGTGEVGECVSRALVDFEAAVEIDMLEVWWGTKGGKGGGFIMDSRRSFHGGGG